MAMTVRMVIDGLLGDIKTGYFQEDDLLVIDWFSFRDVHRKVSDYEEGRTISDDTARKTWAVCVETIDMEVDTFGTEAINDVIDGVVGES
jgi:hypothetical protein